MCMHTPHIAMTVLSSHKCSDCGTKSGDDECAISTGYSAPFFSYLLGVKPTRAALSDYECICTHRLSHSCTSNVRYTLNKALARGSCTRSLLYVSENSVHESALRLRLRPDCGSKYGLLCSVCAFQPLPQPTDVSLLTIFSLSLAVGVMARKMGHTESVLPRVSPASALDRLFMHTDYILTHMNHLSGGSETPAHFEQLERSLQQFGERWEVNPGDGAFYGPKIDIQIKDAIGRQHQCATIQLDFQLPIRFDLQYVGKDGQSHRPVMIHRAVLGSLERMIAILSENFGGKWPLWLSPAQIMVLPVGGSSESYAKQVVHNFSQGGFLVDINDDHGATLNKKIRSAQLAQYNYIFVVGEMESESGTVNVRSRRGKQLGRRTLEEVMAALTQLRDTRSNLDEF
ncbi:hypothetical protein WMY93_025646 [Mugilogobius chulae]|uniref:threonine--tRNA ligase n=1 Tax=Mugilogobius chulae TaxID=88201 RepID=A0AAW0N728_9GOBI